MKKHKKINKKEALRIICNAALDRVGSLEDAADECEAYGDIDAAVSFAEEASEIRAAVNDIN